MAKKSAKKKVVSPDVPVELSQAISAKKCALFIGAGLSVAAGYPNWQVLLTDLIKKAHQRKFINLTLKKELIKHLADSSKLLLIAEELREIYGSDVFRRELFKEFEKNLQPTHTHLKLMDIPFKFAVTTNYDLLLERAYLKKYKDMPPAFSNMQPPEISEALWRRLYSIGRSSGKTDMNRAWLEYRLTKGLPI